MPYAWHCTRHLTLYSDIRVHIQVNDRRWALTKGNVTHVFPRCMMSTSHLIYEYTAEGSCPSRCSQALTSIIAGKEQAHGVGVSYALLFYPTSDDLTARNT